MYKIETFTRKGADVSMNEAYTTSMRLMPSGSFTSCIIKDNLLRVFFTNPITKIGMNPQVKQEGSNPIPLDRKGNYCTIGSKSVFV